MWRFSYDRPNKNGWDRKFAMREAGIRPTHRILPVAMLVRTTMMEVGAETPFAPQCQTEILSSKATRTVACNAEVPLETIVVGGDEGFFRSPVDATTIGTREIGCRRTILVLVFVAIRVLFATIGIPTYVTQVHSSRGKSS